jgi:hypothetical protein
MSAFMLSVVILIVANNTFMLSIAMLSVFLPNVIMLRVVAPLTQIMRKKANPILRLFVFQTGIAYPFVLAWHVRLLKWRHVTQYNGIQHNNTYNIWLNPVTI